MRKLGIAAVTSLLASYLIGGIAAPAMAAAPNLNSIVKQGTTQASGSVSGDYQVVIQGTGFCASGVDQVTSASIGGLELTNLTVTCGTPDSLEATVPARSLVDRSIGAALVKVTTDAISTDSLYFSFVPDVDATYAAIQQTEVIHLGELFSRTQRKPIVRSATSPYTVTGVDSLSGETYTYITNINYLAGLDCDPESIDFQAEDCGAYTHEPDLGEAVHPGSLGPVVLDHLDPATDLVVTTGVKDGALSTFLGDLDSNSDTISTANGALSPTNWLNGREVVELYSDLDCSPDAAQGDTTPDNGERGDLDPNNYFDSGDGDGPKYTYCAGFGPDVYSEPFQAESGQSLAFEWAAIGDSDDYAVYAFLVKVDETTGEIPAEATVDNHSIAMYASGSQEGTSDWNTSTVDITEAGTYRFRFINGSFDGTGGYKLGSLFYLSSLFLTGDTNAVDFGPFDDRVTQPGDTFVVNASSTAGGEVTVVTLSPSVCTVTSLSTTPPTYTVTVVSTDDTCLLQASQGATGTYAPSASVLATVVFRSAAVAPDAPTLLSVTPGDSELTADWNAGPNGGDPITNYEYSTDNGATWVAIEPAITTTEYTITGLTNGTTYDVKIRAVNGIGTGAASNMLQGTPAAPEEEAPADRPAPAAPYSGPVVTPVDPQVPKAPAGKANFNGSNLDQVTKVEIDGTEVEFELVDGQLQLVLPPGIKPGLYDVTVSGTFGSLLVQQAVLVEGVAETPDIGKRTWTSINEEKSAVRIIYKNPVGVGKVQFKLNGVEFAWVRAADATDPKLRTYTLEGVEIPYLVRNVVLTPGIKNAFEIYVDGVRVWRAAYYSAD